MNNLTIRLETEKDYRAVEELTREAFWNIYKPRLEYFYRSVLFEKHQHIGDCIVNERFANTFSAFLSCLSVNRYERIKNE